MAEANNLETITGELHTIDPKTIKVRDGLPRYRKELGDVEDLARSIKEKGQIQPVVVTRELELIAGGRRLAACLVGDIPVKVIYSDMVDDYTLRELEAEENFQRKAFTPAEEIMALDDLHRIKQELYGKSCSGRTGGWTTEKTAELAKRSRASVVDDLQLAEIIRTFPELNNAKTKSEIRRAARAVSDLRTRSEAAVKYDETVKKTKLPVTYDLAPAEEHMPSQNEASVDILLTDPPYGMDVFDNVSSGSKILGAAGFKYNDTTDEALILYQLLAFESYRFCKDTSHAYIFCCPEHFWRIRSYFEAAGWRPHLRPLIWIKRRSGQNNAPFHWPSSCYEMILYARRENSVLVKPGMPDWLQYDPVSDTERVHQAQKPVPLLRDLISRSVYPNSTLYDPFCGSAATVEAGLEEKLIVRGCEKLQEAYDSGRSQILKYQKRKEALP